MANAILVNNPNSEIDLPLLVIQFDNLEEMQSLRLLTRLNGKKEGYRLAFKSAYATSWAIQDPKATDKGIYEIMSSINKVLQPLK